jgi:hypothetical protein
MMFRPAVCKDGCKIAWPRDLFPPADNVGSSTLRDRLKDPVHIAMYVAGPAHRSAIIEQVE